MVDDPGSRGDSADLEPRSSGWDWRPAVALIAVVGLTEASTAAIRPVTAYLATVRFDADAGRVGLLGACFNVVPVMCAIGFGPIVRRFGAARLLVTAAGVLPVSALALQHADFLAVLYLNMLVLGGASILIVLSAQTMIVTLAPLRRGVAMLTVGVGVGQLLGPALFSLAGALSGDGSASESVTRVTLVCPVLCPIVAAFFMRWAIRHGGALPFHSTTRDSESSFRNPSVFREWLSLRGVMSPITVGAVTLAASDTLVIFLPLYGASVGISLSFVGVLLALQAFAALSVRLCYEPILSRIQFRSVVAIALLTASAALLLIPIVGRSSDVMLCLLMVATGCGLGFGQPLSLHGLLFAAPVQLRASALGLRIAINRAVQMASPVVVGRVVGISTVSLGVFGSLATALFGGYVVSTLSGRESFPSAPVAGEERGGGAPGA